MKYNLTKKAVFLCRPNRFIAECLLDGKEITAHVKNTGRCRELLVPGYTVWLEYSSSPARKTCWSLIAVEKPSSDGILLINMDSQAPNAAAYEALLNGALPFSFLSAGKAPQSVKRETVFEDSRFDLSGRENGRDFFIEVKGVTLEQDGAVFFPDAPTERGVKHLNGLKRASLQGICCGVLFVVQMKDAEYFAPNWKTHSAFGQALQQAQKEGVELLAMCCRVEPDSISISHKIPLHLEADMQAHTNT